MKMAADHFLTCYVKALWIEDTIESKTNRSFAHFLCKWGHFERAKSTFKMLPASWFFVYLFKRFRSFIAENLESVSQRAAKLLAVKVGGLKKKSASRPRPQSASLPGFDSRRSRIIFKLWWLVNLQPIDLQTLNFQQ